MAQLDPPDLALEHARELIEMLTELAKRLKKGKAPDELLEDARQFIHRAYGAAFGVPESGPGRRAMLLSICSLARGRLQKAPSRKAAEVSLVVQTYDELVDEESAKLCRKPPDAVADESLDARDKRLKVAARDEAKRLRLLRAVLTAATPKTLEKAEMALIKAMALGFTADPESVKRHERRVKKKSRES